MSSKAVTRLAENRTVFDDRPILESELEITESGEYALYVAERVAADTDEIHIFPIGDNPEARERVHTVLKQLSEDPDVPVSKLSFQTGVDGRLIVSVQAVPCAEEFNAGRGAATYLQTRI